jgi:predicted AAA+ superfamily ATPase
MKIKNSDTLYLLGVLFTLFMFRQLGHNHFIVSECGLRKKIVVGLYPKKPLLQQRMGKTARVVVCGLKRVGKTAILEQLIYGNISNTTVWMQFLFCVLSNL